MAGFRIEGNTSGNVVEVTTANQMKVVPETDAAANPDNIGGIRIFSEVDQGLITGAPRLLSPEADNDYRLRVSSDLIRDEEHFNYTAQNTGKHSYVNTTMTNVWTAGQLTTNGTSITTTTTGTVFQTYAFFPMYGTQTLSADVNLAFSAQPQANTFVEFGPMLPGAATVPPVDGVFFRLNASGLQGIASYNGAESSSGVFPLADGTGVWTYDNAKRYQFICYETPIAAMFWVNDGTGAVLLGQIPLPAGQSRMSMATSRPFALKHRITGGAAGGVLQATMGSYNVRIGGSHLVSTPSIEGSRLAGSYQGTSGSAMGSLATYPNSTNPTAAVPSNTALTANLPGGRGGQGAVIAAVAAATDGIWGSYQIPAGTVNIAGQRSVIRGVNLHLVNLGAAVATTATTIQFSLAYGHTAVSLATAEGAATKAPRRIAIGIATWPVGAAIGATPTNGPIFLDLGDAPVFVNPGEYVQLVGKFLVGTATASQVIHFTWQPVYGPE